MLEVLLGAVGIIVLLVAVRVATRDRKRLRRHRRRQRNLAYQSLWTAVFQRPRQRRLRYAPEPKQTE